MLVVTQILCSESYATFATSVSSDKGVICAVSSLINFKAIISNSAQQGPNREAASLSASRLSPTIHVTRRFITKEAVGGLEDICV